MLSFNKVSYINNYQFFSLFFHALLITLCKLIKNLISWLKIYFTHLWLQLLCPQWCLSQGRSGGGTGWWLAPDDTFLWGPIRGQYWGHVICSDQSEALMTHHNCPDPASFLQANKPFTEKGKLKTNEHQEVLVSIFYLKYIFCCCWGSKLLLLIVFDWSPPARSDMSLFLMLSTW